MKIRPGDTVAIVNYGGENDSRVGTLVKVTSKYVMLHAADGGPREWRNYTLSKIGDIVRVKDAN